MSKQKELEMEEIYLSFEYLFREKLESIDHMSRMMFSEMAACRINEFISRAFVQEKFRMLALEVIEKGDAQIVKSKPK